MKTQKFLARTAFASMPGHHWERGKPGARKFQAPQHDWEAWDLVAKRLYVTSTFMRLSPGGRLNPGRDHEMEKSAYINVKGQWRYLYRAVDKHGQTIDFLLTEARDEPAAKRFLTKVTRRPSVPETITIEMLGFKSIEAAQSPLAAVELMHMLKKGHLVVGEKAKDLTPAEQFYALAA